MDKIIIGITGKSGSGKSTLAFELGRCFPNATIINVDEIGHEALCRPKILKQLKERFGNEILDETGAVDRKKLGNIVFAEREKMQQLTEAAYLYISKKINYIVETTNGVLIFDWILLPEDSIWSKCDIKVLVHTDLQTRKKKVIVRDNITDEYFDAREKTSIEYSEEQFDYVFYNDYEENSIINMAKYIQSNIVKLNKKIF